MSYLPEFFKDSERRRVFLSAVWLYMSSCVSLTLSTKTIGYWMYDQSYSYASISFIGSMLHLPYSMRILFTPWFEFIKIYEIGSWGYRKSLLFWFTCINIICISLISIFGFSSFWFVFLICMICSIISTSAESVTSAYFMTTYSAKVRPNWVQGGQIGYNIGLYFTYTLILALSAYFTWNVLYAACIIFMIANIFVLACLDDCKFERQQQPNIQKVYWIPLTELYKKHKQYFSPLVLFSLFYRAPDKMLGPILPLFMVSLYGKVLAAVLKTFSLLAMLIGSFVWRYLGDEHPMDRLLKISKIHLVNILSLGCATALYLYTSYTMTALVCISIIGFFIKFVRTMESAAIFHFQCSLFDGKFFNAQSAVGTLADKAFGDILAATAGSIRDAFGFSIFFIISGVLVLPSWFNAYVLKKYKLNVN